MFSLLKTPVLQAQPLFSQSVSRLMLMLPVVLGEVTASPLALARCYLYPAGNPDGVIDIPDLILLLNLLQ